MISGKLYLVVAVLVAVLFLWHTYGVREQTLRQSGIDPTDPMATPGQLYGLAAGTLISAVLVGLCWPLVIAAWSIVLPVRGMARLLARPRRNRVEVYVGPGSNNESDRRPE